MGSLPQLIEEDISELDQALRELLGQSEATMALLIDKGGFLITRRGDHNDFDATTLAALSAASFAATQGIASLVSETNFSTIYQQGETYSMLVLNIDEFCLLTVIFKAFISVGAVKYFALPTIRRIALQLRIAQHRTPGAGLDLSLLNLADPTPVFRRKTA